MQNMLCRLELSDSGLVVRGLSVVWPPPYSRRLVPLNYKQQTDPKLADLLTMFDRVPRRLQLR